MSEKTPCCSFCGKTKEQTRSLIAGNDAFICDECIQLCSDMITEPDFSDLVDETPLKKWATPREIAEWAYFLTVTNTFCTGQNILVDGGESINYHFIWKD